MAGMDFLAFPQDVSALDVVNYQYFNQLLNKRTIIFNQEVDGEIMERVYLPLKDFEQDDSNEPVNLIISTPGGLMHESFFLANVFDNYTKPLIITGTGLLCSMGLILMSAGSKNPNVVKRCFKNTVGLLHTGSIKFDDINMDSAVDFMAFQQKLTKNLREYIISNTGLTEETYKKHEKEEWYLTGEELKEYGFVDEVL